MPAQYVTDGQTFNAGALAQDAVVKDLAEKILAAPAPVPAATVISNAAAASTSLPLCRLPGPLDFWYALVEHIDWADFWRNLLLFVFVLSTLFALFMLCRWILGCCSNGRDEVDPAIARAVIVQQALQMRDPLMSSRRQ